MELVDITKRKATSRDIEKIADALLAKQVVVLPTDTIYGLHGRADSESVIKRIHRIKQDRQDKSYLILVSSLEMLGQYCGLNREQGQYLNDLWIGNKNPKDPAAVDNKYHPTTVILYSKLKLAKNLESEGRTLAVRLPKNELLIKILEKVNIPLVSTSLNISGQPLINVQKIKDTFASMPDLAVDRGPMRTVRPSRLIDIRDIGDIKLIRE